MKIHIHILTQTIRAKVWQIHLNQLCKRNDPNITQKEFNREENVVIYAKIDYS